MRLNKINIRVFRKQKEHTLGLNIFDILLSASATTRTSNTSRVIRHESTLHMDTTTSRLGKTDFRNENTFLNDLTTSLTPEDACERRCLSMKGERRTRYYRRLNPSPAVHPAHTVGIAGQTCRVCLPLLLDQE